MEELVLEIFILLTIGAAMGAMLLYATLRIGGPLAGRKPPKQLEFRFCNKELVGACRHAQRSFSPDDLDGTLYDRLLSRLDEVFPNLRNRIESNSAHWDSFALSTPTSDGVINVEVEISDRSLVLQISGLDSPLSRQHLVDADKANAEAQELRHLRNTIDASPFPTWREQADGSIEWANEAYKSLCKQAQVESNTGIGRLFHGGQVASAGQTPTSKRANVSLEGGEVAAFEVMRIAHKDYTLNFAADASKTIKAEDGLHRFMQTLTRTFASLPIGLAVFDRARNLVMFNPALADLTTIDPAWLTARPTLSAVLDELRELRMIPERRDFQDWRGKIAELEKSANDGTYCETWSLPNGQTYRFTGQPHPEGAVAFLIEDITAEITLTRKFRRELALSQSLIDQMPNALIVFGSDGVIAMTNSAYHELWNTDPEDALGQLTITDATRLWQMHSTPNPVWGDARDFATQGGERAEWTDKVFLKNGRHLECRFQPLSGNATLVEFEASNMSSEASGTQTKLAAVSS